MYVKYFHYKKQGVATLGFPLPLIGNALDFKKALSHQKDFHHPTISYVTYHFGEDAPQILADFKMNTGSLLISSPEILQELYTTKNLYFDKFQKFKNVQSGLFGNALIFSKSDQAWQHKRKTFSAAFHSKNLIRMFDIVLRKAQSKVQEWKNIYADQPQREFDLCKEFQDLVTGAVQGCVFGIDQTDIKLDFSENGRTEKLTIGHFFRNVLIQFVRRYDSVLRLLFDVFDKTYFGQSEKEALENSRRLRAYIVSQIEEKKQLLSQGQTPGNDFISILLNDELFYNDPNAAVDECLTLMAAATQTTVSTASNLLMYLIQNPKYKSIVRDEIKKLKTIDYSVFQNLDNLNMLQACINETLRLDPPVEVSTQMQLTQSINVCGIQFRNDHPFEIDFHHMQRNPKEWVKPNEFIPERFDPSSKYFLRPDGQKRNPYSFGPFLGGKRMCLGKTFAEQFIKCTLAIILKELDFEYVDPSFYDFKPRNHLATPTPTILLRVKTVCQ